MKDNKNTSEEPTSVESAVAKWINGLFTSTVDTMTDAKAGTKILEGLHILSEILEKNKEKEKERENALNEAKGYFN